MLQMHIISVGKLSAELQPIAKEFEKMIKYRLKNTEILHSSKSSPAQVKHQESKSLLSSLSSKSYKILLDVEGKQIDSYQFTKLINSNIENALLIEFIIGGAFGVDNIVKQQADYVLSLSKLTLPHKIAKIILLEQIYRAQTIIIGHPYHKA